MLALASIADTVNLEGVPRGDVAIPTAHILLNAFNLRREELHGAATLGANHVVMAATVVLVLVTRNPIMELDRTGKPTIGEKLQGAVDSCKPDS